MGLRRLWASGSPVFGCTRLQSRRGDRQAREQSFSGATSGAVQPRTHADAARDEASGVRVEPSACILVQTIEPQARGLDHGQLGLGHASKVEKAFARFFVDALARFANEHGLGFVDRYSHALWKQRQYQGPGQAERAARYLSKYVSKERASEWLREKVGQRVFYVAPWLSRAAGASMRIARLGRRMWAADHGYCERPRCTDGELEAVMRFLASREGPAEGVP